MMEVAGFAMSNGVQSFLVPGDGTYQISSYGAVGVNNNGVFGKGAIMKAQFDLKKGDQLWVLVGQKSVYNGVREWQGGSGGSFVAIGNHYSSASPLIVAGGAGTNRSSATPSSFMDASTATYAKDGTGSAGGIDGQASQGGGHNQDPGGGGSAGFYGDAKAKEDTRYGSTTGSASFLSGSVGGVFRGGDNGEYINGAFGGGGPGGWGGAGGGGGYSGGGNSANSGYAGGGGSFIAASATNAATSNGGFSITGQEPTPAYSGSVQSIGSFNSGAGKVIIEKL